MYKVYQITNIINGTKYIGFTSKDIDVRFEQHCSRKNCTKMRYAIDKYGKDNFKIEVLVNFVNREDALNFENTAINAFNTLHPNGYNLSEGGIAPKMSTETRIKMSNSQKARPQRPPMSQVQKNKISKTRMERGIKQSPETILKMLETKKRNNKPMPEGFGKKISERQMGVNNPSAKAVRCLNDGLTFDTIKQASDYYNIPNINIIAMLKGRNKTANKLKFEYTRE